jgi:hypothetical protein
MYKKQSVMANLSLIWECFILKTQLINHIFLNSGSHTRQFLPFHFDLDRDLLLLSRGDLLRE